MFLSYMDYRKYICITFLKLAEHGEPWSYVNHRRFVIEISSKSRDDTKGTAKKSRNLTSVCTTSASRWNQVTRKGVSAKENQAYYKLGCEGVSWMDGELKFIVPSKFPVPSRPPFETIRSCCGWPVVGSIHCGGTQNWWIILHPTSLNGLFAGIQHHLRENLGRAAPNIINKKMTYFQKKKNALDQQLRLLRKKGIGVMKKQAPIITPEQETQLWESGVLGVHSPEALMNVMFFYNGKNFFLRRVSEQEELHFNQIHLLRNPLSI